MNWCRHVSFACKNKGLVYESQSRGGHTFDLGNIVRSFVQHPRGTGLDLNLQETAYDVDAGSSFGGSTNIPFSSFVRH